MSIYEINPEVIDLEEDSMNNTAIYNCDSEVISIDMNLSDANGNEDDSDYKEDYCSDDKDEIVFNSILDKKNS